MYLNLFFPSMISYIVVLTIVLLLLCLRRLTAMPCTFSGIFLVNQFHNNKLLCQTSDELGNIHNVEIVYYFPSKMERPFPEAYESIQTGNVYFITGTFAITGSIVLVYVP